MKWTATEKATVNRMKGEGASTDRIASALHRTVQSVEGFIRWRDTPPEARLKKAKYVYAYRRQMGLVGAGRGGIPVHSVMPIAPDPQAIADRDYRVGLPPRSLTAFICGDPAIGYSALDRR